MDRFRLETDFTNQTLFPLSISISLSLSLYIYIYIYIYTQVLLFVYVFTCQNISSFRFTVNIMKREIFLVFIPVIFLRFNHCDVCVQIQYDIFHYITHTYRHTQKHTCTTLPIYTYVRARARVCVCVFVFVCVYNVY